MFFESPEQIEDLAARTGFAIFVGGNIGARFNAYISVKPNENGKIDVEQVREITSLMQAKQACERYIYVEHAETMNEAAQNAFLKTLEEPHEGYHLVLLAETTAGILPTVLSRAQVFFLRPEARLDAPVAADEKVKDLARALIRARAADLPDLATKMAAKKDDARGFALRVVATAIEILEKSYFATSDAKFLVKMPKFLRLYENLAQNGHIKLHIVADLI